MRNSIGKPTPIFVQPLTDDLLHLTGAKVELIRNDPAGWEGGVVKGPYILRHGNHFYLFYAGNACCGRECNYAERVARSAALLGPWRKILPIQSSCRTVHGSARDTALL